MGKNKKKKKKKEIKGTRVKPGEGREESKADKKKSMDKKGKGGKKK